MRPACPRFVEPKQLEQTWVLVRNADSSKPSEAQLGEAVKPRTVQATQRPRTSANRQKSNTRRSQAFGVLTEERRGQGSSSYSKQQRGAGWEGGEKTNQGKSFLRGRDSTWALWPRRPFVFRCVPELVLGGRGSTWAPCLLSVSPAAVRRALHYI